MLEFENVSKAFWTGTHHKVILDRVSFRVGLGNSLGVLAPNGTGKSTLINMIAGMEKPDEGVIRRECRISFAMGTVSGTVPTLTAVENCRFIARIYGMDPDYVESYCRWMCDLGEYFERPLITYSAGMKARFSTALLLSLQFDIYLIDEGMPSTLDAEFTKKAGDIMREKMETATFIIVSHDPEILEKYVKHAAVLRFGQLYMFDTLEEAAQLYDYHAQNL